MAVVLVGRLRRQGGFGRLQLPVQGARAVVQVEHLGEGVAGVFEGGILQRRPLAGAAHQLDRALPGCGQPGAFDRLDDGAAIMGDAVGERVDQRRV